MFSDPYQGAAASDWTLGGASGRRAGLARQDLVAGPGILIDRRRGQARISLDPTAFTAACGGAAGTQYGYNSYFKLTLNAGATAGGDAAFSVTIADGATGGDSVAVVNGTYRYRIPPYTEAVSSYRLFYLKYRPPVYGSSSTPLSPAAMEIGSNDDMYLAAYWGGEYYLQLGRVFFNNGVAEVVQDFSGGVADMRWYMQC